VKVGFKMFNYEIRHIGSHVEIYSLDGSFLFSANTTREAMEGLAN